MRIIKSIIVAASLVILGSCSTPKNIAYFPDLTDGEVIVTQEVTPWVVRPEDKLSIVVNSKDGSLANLFNLPITTRRLGDGSITNGAAKNYSYLNGTEGISNYTVNPEGNIDFPVLGELHVAGLTRSQVASLIKEKLISGNYVKDPTVTVEFLNSGISVMGEVESPGRYDINRDRLTILDALTLAGDLTIYGQRNNVLVIRQLEDGKSISYRLDLTDGKKLIESPAYYLQQNDVVYVEPNPFRKRETTVNGNSVLNASFWVSIASLLTTIAVIVFK